MLEILDDVKIEKNEVFGFVGLVDSGRTTILKKIYKANKSRINYVDELPELTFLKVKTFLGKNKNHEYVKKLDLDINKRINDLNYNETRKFLFLRSIFTTKEIIILDEPLLLVENSTKKVMLEIIKEIKKTFLISFDNLTEAKIICDRYAIIKDYKIAQIIKNKKEQDTLNVLLKAPNIDKASLPLKDMKINHFTHDEIEFIYKGDINKLLKYLVDINISFLEVKSATLEDLYKYYLKN